MNKRLSLQFIASALALPWAASSFAQNTASPEWVNAEITRLQLDRNRVTLKHERIPSIKMDSMTMPFKLKDAKLLDGYKVGDKLQIVVKNDDGDLFITQVRKQP
jgi:Cu(I)/Ag(I) efflux system periplasmic protein CusF